MNPHSIITSGEKGFGDIRWSPNNQYFVFSFAENFTGPDSSEHYSVFLVNFEGLPAKQVYTGEDQILRFPQWVSNREVKYFYSSGIETTWIILNIETGEVIDVES